MGRHSKNAGGMGTEGYTYHERRALGHGTLTERIGKDSQRNFDDCCLSLQTVVDPVCTPDGYLYSKEAILMYILAQKKLKKRELAAWEAQEEREAQEALEKGLVREQAQLLAFDRQNHLGGSARMTKQITSALNEEAATMHDPKTAHSVWNVQEYKDRAQAVKSFWASSHTPDAKQRLEKPSVEVNCPMSGKKLRLKDLTPVRFTPVPASITGEGRYIDPISDTIFTNAHQLVCLKQTGDVMTLASYKRIVKPEGQYNGKRVKEKDVIKLQMGGTGFASHDGERAQSSVNFALGAGSGRADLRGQAAAGTSRAGLVFNN